MIKRLWKTVSLTLVAAMFLAACGGGATPPSTGGSQPQEQQQAPQSKGPVALKVAYSSDASTLDPHLTADTATEVINKNIYNNLVRFNTEMQIVGDLAEKWSVAEDGLTWTFDLRKGVKFHDGTPFNAEAVKVNIERVLNPDTAAPRRSVLAPIQKIEVTGEHQVVFTTSRPTGALPQYLAHPVGAMISPAAIQTHGKELGRNPVGTGPFIYESWTANQTIVLKKNPDYFENTVAVDTLEFQIVPEAATRALLLESGQVDVAISLPIDLLPQLEAKGVNIQKVDTVKTTYIALNATKGPLADPRVRQAINYAVDKQPIADNLLSGLARVADAPMSNMTFGYKSTGVYEYNPERAKALLAEAGVPDGFEFEIWTPDGRYLGDRQIAEYVQGQLSKVGIKASVRTWEFQALLTELKKGEFDSVLLAWSPSTGDADLALYSVFHSSQLVTKGGSNRAMFGDEALDKLLEAGQVETDVQKRLSIYADAQKKIFEEAPWLFLVFPMEVMATQKNVTGVEVLATEHQLFARAKKN